MNQTRHIRAKTEFRGQLTQFVSDLSSHTSTSDGQWTIKGFVDVFQNIYTVSTDTKIVSKILEIHLFPKILEFANAYGYKIVLTDHQNYYPDITFIRLDDETVRFALDFKTTYRLPENLEFCNGFTLGSHGEYFVKRVGSITRIADILTGNGMFKLLGESWFDDYWMNYGKITITDEAGTLKKITRLKDFLAYRGEDDSLINARVRRTQTRRTK